VFRLDDKAGIEQRRAEALSGIQATPSVRETLMLLIGEVKEFAPARSARRSS